MSINQLPFISCIVVYRPFQKLIQYSCPVQVSKAPIFYLPSNVIKKFHSFCLAQISFPLERVGDNLVAWAHQVLTRSQVDLGLGSKLNPLAVYTVSTNNAKPCFKIYGWKMIEFHGRHLRFPSKSFYTSCSYPYIPKYVYINSKIPTNISIHVYYMLWKFQVIWRSRKKVFY